MKALHKLQQAFAADLWGDDLHHMHGLILDDKLSAARRFNAGPQDTDRESIQLSSLPAFDNPRGGISDGNQ